jgi:hypothetical protein
LSESAGICELAQNHLQHLADLVTLRSRNHDINRTISATHGIELSYVTRILDGTMSDLAAAAHFPGEPRIDTAWKEWLVVRLNKAEAWLRTAAPPELPNSKPPTYRT